MAMGKLMGFKFVVLFAVFTALRMRRGGNDLPDRGRLVLALLLPCFCLGVFPGSFLL